MTGSTKLLTPGGGGVILTPNASISSDVVVNLPTVAGTLALLSQAGGIPSGTIMLFRQTAAPTGWTKDTTNYDNSALRVVTGSVSSGGTVDFSTAFASQAVSGTVGATTLATTQIPSHAHATQAYYTPVAAAYFYSAGAQPFNTGSGTSAAGGGGSHTHSFTGTAINLAVKYCDVIFAVKD